MYDRDDRRPHPRPRPRLIRDRRYSGPPMRYPFRAGDLEWGNAGAPVPPGRGRGGCLGFGLFFALVSALLLLTASCAVSGSCHRRPDGPDCLQPVPVAPRPAPVWMR